MVMKTLTLTDMRKNLFGRISDVIKKHEPLRVTYKSDTVVILNETDFENMIETIQLLSEPDFKKKLKNAEREVANGQTYSLDEVFK